MVNNRFLLVADKFLDLVVNKFHLILAAAAQGSVIFYRFKTGSDLGPGLTNSLYAFYAFLGGHAFTYQKFPDKDDHPDQQ
jgi:hypothetical protein